MKDPCAHCEEMMQPYLDHVLTEEEMAQAEAHLAECEHCRRRYRFEESLRIYVRKAVDGADAGRAPAEAGRAQDSAGVGRSTSPAAAGRRRGRARRERLRALVGDVVPERPREQDGVEADAAVGRGDRVAAVRAPVLDDAVDRARVEVGPVGERDDRGLRVRRERGEAAAERGAGAALPVGQWTLSTGSACAPLTTTISSTELSRNAASTCGSSSTCFGGSVP